MKYTLFYFATLFYPLQWKKNPLLRFEKKLWSYLGNLSFGIYMWHFIVLGFIFSFLKYFRINNETIVNIALYTCGLPLTILIAHFSYIYIEQPFLHLKKKFTVVNSGGA
ncbi:acyltransferase family protein [Hymenobacter busanensis]|uniref:acyltransferase family protein n=1 Tax=Hymenobacter busanensis TaxID=2607656 RepID=UPI003B845BAF